MSYTIALAGLANGTATFEVTRTLPDDNTPVVWVTTDCLDADGNRLEESWQDDAPVIWGTWDSPTGTASLPVYGATCIAKVTVTPWRPKRNDPSITFTV